MILTVCPNPCLDCTFELEKFNVGMLNRIENKAERFAGKALNVAIGVARLGEKVKTTGFMFENGGRRCSAYLTKEGVESDFVWNEGNIRSNYKIIDGKSMMTEINDKGDDVLLSKQEELLSKINKLSANCSFCVISGSLPGGMDDKYYLDMVKAVDPSAKVVVDCEKQKMLYALSHGVFLVKPNLFELESVNNESYSNITEMLDGCKKLIEKGAKYVLLSLGKEGAILTNGEEGYYCKSDSIAVNSTVGAGDSLLASSLVAFDEGKPIDEVLRCGVAAGTAAIISAGANLFFKDKYQSILPKLKVMKI